MVRRKRCRSGATFLLFGPYVDERAIDNAWFVLEHAGRLTEMTCLAFAVPAET
jgi:hypothetical protein